MSSTDHHFLREDRAIHWGRIAEHLAASPGDLAIPLANIERWLALGRVHPTPLLDWRRRILAARTSATQLADFLNYLREDDHDSNPFKSCSPFVGLPFEETALA